MSYRVNHVNKKTGVTYVYESTSYWDKEKKQPRSKQVCIGKLDPVSGAFVPSKRLKSEQASVRDPAVTASVQTVGPSMVLDAITERLGLGELLKACFPKHHRSIQTMAYYLTAQGGALSACASWCKNHAPELVEALSSQRITEILSGITMDAKQTFLKAWMHKMLEHDYVCYDITSISSYAEMNEYIK